MTIAFNTIPIGILTPGAFIEFDNSKFASGLPVMPHRILVIAPRLATGTLAALKPSRVRSGIEGEAFCGRGSPGAEMIKAAKIANPYTELWAIGVDQNGAGALAAGTFTLTGPATGAGTVNVYIAGDRVSVGVNTGDTAASIATALVAAINADTSLPVTAAAVGAVVTCTARYKGIVGNEVDLRINYNDGDYLPAGVGVAIVAMTGGATNPDLTAVTAALGDTWYNTIITPFTDALNLTVLESFMGLRWGGMVMKEGQVFGAQYGTHAAIGTAVNARNSGAVSIFSIQKSPTPAYVFAAVAGAIDAFQASDPSNCNRPRKSLELVGVLPPAETDRYMQTERQAHLTLGASTFVVDEGGVCRLDRVITTYKTSNGVPDTSYRDIERMRALAYIRYSTRVRWALKYSRHKLREDDGKPIPPGQPIMTPKVGRDELFVLGKEWYDVGLIQNLDQYKRDLLVEIDSGDDTRMNAIIPPDIVVGLQVFAASVQFR